MVSKTIERLLLGLIVLAYLVIGVLYAVKTPAWQVPDEPAHYNYVRQVAENGCCPHIQPGDWDNDYLNSIKAAKFSDQAVGDRITSIRYEDHQPPLYYVLASPVYTLGVNKLLDLRLFSVLLGAGVVIVAWATVRTLFPTVPWLALAAAAFVAFLPQHIAMMAGVENDSLAELLVGLTLLGCVSYLGNTRRRVHPLLLGIVCAAVILTKITAYPAVAIVALVVLIIARREKWTFGKLIRVAAWIAIPVIMAGSFWALRNISIYGGFDILGLSTHDSVVIGQPKTSDYIAAQGFSAWLKDALQTTFDSFWGQFGWMGVPMSGPIYAGLLGVSLLIITGAGIAFIRWRKALTVAQRDALIVFAISSFLTFLGLVYWNIKYVQFQGRYLYPALIPLSIVVAAGIGGWLGLLRSRSAQWITVGIVCLLAVLDIYALYRIIIPALS